MNTSLLPTRFRGLKLIRDQVRAVSITFLLLGVGHGMGADESTAALRTLVKANTTFALDLYQQVKGQEGNLFFSPFSLSTCLAMTYVGARGQTSNELARVLHFTLPPGELYESFRRLNRRLSDIGIRKQLTLNVANSVWTQSRYHFEQQYLDLNRKFFDARIGAVDFERNPAAACREINDWVAGKTADKIKDLLAPDALDQRTRMVLCNAIHFKGDWEKQFDPRATSPAEFFVTAGRSVKAPMMFREMKIKMYEAGVVSVIELRYASGTLSMIVFLPAAQDGLARLESNLTLPSLAQWLGGLSQSKEEETMVWLPKFKASSRFDMSKVLAAMGMPAAFALQTADFSGMTGRRDLFISAASHAAFCEVNEQGTEATAATGLVATLGDLPPHFLADHPFLFLIRENLTGSILFLGRVVDPTR